MPGTPKTISKIADSGSEITSYFCPDCGTTLYRTTETFPDCYTVKMGIMDDPEWPNERVPKVELFAPARASWLQPVEGAVQKRAMS